MNFYTTPMGRNTTDYNQYVKWMIEERGPDWNKNQADVGASGDGDSTKNLTDTYTKLFDKQFENTSKLMDLTHGFRQKEGATQGQMDAQAFKRLNAELETRKYMQGKGQELTNWQRDQDAKRAMTSFKTVGK